VRVYPRQAYPQQLSAVKHKNEGSFPEEDENAVEFMLPSQSNLPMIESSNANSNFNEAISSRMSKIE
jgi:hypothetical protein